jgi:membrane-bound lytic murein transglycosylase D
MAIRARLLSIPVGLPLLWILAGAGVGCADSSLDEPIVAHAAMPPPVDEAEPVQSPEHFPDLPSSASKSPAPEFSLGPIMDHGSLTAFPFLLETGEPWLSEEFPPYAVVPHPRTRYFLNRFTGVRREVIERWLERSGRYIGMVRDTFRRHGLPEELAFTAMIESGFDPFAVSRAGAKGIWQFMARTARRYGLRVDPWVDDRLDPAKSTAAAAAYLRDLHSQFGSWFLAQAAYNAGGGRVQRAIRLSRSNDFWDLARTRHLRAETKDFVPAIQAMTLIGLEPGRYGFELTEYEPPRFDTVRVPPLTDLRRLSRTVDVPLASLQDLNPELWRGVTPPRIHWDLKVPEGAREGVRQALSVARRQVASAGSARLGVHVVKGNETISGIAKRYGVTVNQIVRWNKLARQDLIRPGDRIRIARVAPAEIESGQGGFR